MLRSILASEVHHIPLFSDEFVEELTSRLWELLLPFCTWCDHSILMELFCHCSGHKLLKGFESSLDHSIMMSPNIISSLPQISPYYHKTHIALLMKYRNNNIQLKDIVNIRSVMVEKFQITEHAIQLLALHMSSPIVISWKVPNCVLSHEYDGTWILTAGKRNIGSVNKL